MSAMPVIFIMQCVHIPCASFITGSYDRTCKVWDTASGEELHTLEGHRNVVYAIAFNNPYGYVHSIPSPLRHSCIHPATYCLTREEDRIQIYWVSAMFLGKPFQVSFNVDCLWDRHQFYKMLEAEVPFPGSQCRDSAEVWNSREVALIDVQHCAHGSGQCDMHQLYNMVSFTFKWIFSLVGQKKCVYSNMLRNSAKNNGGPFQANLWPADSAILFSPMILMPVPLWVFAATKPPTCHCLWLSCGESLVFTRGHCMSTDLGFQPSLWKLLWDLIKQVIKIIKKYYLN